MRQRPIKFLDALLNAILSGLLVFIAAQQLGMDSASLVAVLGSAGLALGLAIQGSLANFAGGVLILLMKPFKVGDYIVTKDGEGTVFAIGLVYSTLTTVDNRKIVIQTSCGGSSQKYCRVLWIQSGNDIFF